MATTNLTYRIPQDSGGVSSNITDEVIQQAIAARMAGNDVTISAKGGRGGNATLGAESLDTARANKLLDYMIQNNIPASAQGFRDAQIPSGAYAPSRGLMESIAATGAGLAILGPAAGMALSQFAPGIGLSASGGGAGTAAGTAGFGAGSVSPEFASSMMGTTVPTSGGGFLSSLGGAGAGTSGLTAAELASAMEIPAGTMTTVGGALPAAGAASGAGGGLLSSLTNATGLGGNTLGALVSGGASLLAGQQGANAANSAAAESARQFNISQQNLQPWLTAGRNALGAQQDLLGLGTNGPESQLSALMSSPGYEFRKQQGERGLAASSAARGGMGSGKAMTGAMQYGQDYASNEYANRLNQLAGVSGTGQTTGYNLAQLGQQYGSEMGNAALTAAQARQSGILGAGQALSGYLNPLPRQRTLADLLGGI